MTRASFPGFSIKAAFWADGIEELMVKMTLSLEVPPGLGGFKCHCKCWSQGAGAEDLVGLAAELKCRSVKLADTHAEPGSMFLREMDVDQQIEESRKAS